MFTLSIFWEDEMARAKEEKRKESISSLSIYGSTSALSIAFKIWMWARNTWFTRQTSFERSQATKNKQNSPKNLCGEYITLSILLLVFTCSGCWHNNSFCKSSPCSIGNNIGKERLMRFDNNSHKNVRKRDCRSTAKS